MSYIALYRKYRPIVFDDIVGQENVTKILKNQIKSNKISHAYIFSGCRGTGKTSAAKIFARAINCLNPKDGEPCNECEICKKILDNATTDVVEMDAASNNSVENIRQIRQEVVYSTVDAKYRVYIIDEAHMLTTSAFNALLKTLEEPPENVVFILATTEQHKIPITILSRCLKFEFNRLSKNDISRRVKYVLEAENVKYEEEAVNYIATLADGALRDALSILDRCQNEYKDILKYDDILKIVGGIDKETIEKLVSNIFKCDIIESINLIEELINTGKDIRRINSLLVEKLLDILVNKNNEKEQYENVDNDRIIYIIDKLSKLDNDLKFSMSQIVLIKACIVEICSPVTSNSNSESQSSNNADISKLLNKIAVLEEKVNNLSNMRISQSQVQKNVETVNKNVKTDAKIDISNLCEPFKYIEELKKEIVQLGKLKIFSGLTNCKVYEKDNILVLICTNKMAYELLKADESINTIYNTVNSITDKEYLIKLELKEEHQTEESILENILKESGISYTKMD